MVIKVVYLNDAKIVDYLDAVEHFESAAEWAREQCPSFISFDVQDVSDVAYDCDNIAEYKFKNPQDAMWFELKWR